MLAEPHRSREVEPAVAQAVVAAARRVALAGLALHAARPAPDAPAAPEGTAGLSRALGAALRALAERVAVLPAVAPPVDVSGLRPLQVRLAGQLGVGEGTSELPTPTRRAEEDQAAGTVPLLVVETDALVDAVGTIAAAVNGTLQG